LKLYCPAVSHIMVLMMVAPDVIILDPNYTPKVD